MRDVLSNVEQHLKDTEESAVLHRLLMDGKITEGDLVSAEMKNKKLRLKKIIPNLENKIKKTKDGRVSIYLGMQYADDLKKKYAQIYAASEEALIDKLYYQFFGINSITLAEGYIIWQRYRIDIGTNPKTIQENDNDWKLHFKNSRLASMKLKEIRIVDIKDFFLSITRDHQLSVKAFTNAKSVLNGIYMRAVELGIVEHNLVIEIDFKPIKKRCRPQKPKDDYMHEEIRQILNYLRNKDCDIYEYAIIFSFNCFLRIGEIAAIKFCDITEDGCLNVSRSVTRKREASMNEKGELIFDENVFVVEERLKGSADAGFRTVPLTAEALGIIRMLRRKYPDREYIFMDGDRLIYGDKFNKRLKRACDTLGIKYRPSHQIRFTNAYALYEGGIGIGELSTMMGHTNTGTTMHYLRKRASSADTMDNVRHILSVV